MAICGGSRRIMGYQKPPIGAKLNFGHPLAKGLVGCWLFNEGSGGQVFDYSGQSNHGFITNVAAQSATSGWNAGRWGTLLAFDGSNDYIETNYILPTTNFSIGSWGISAATGYGNRLLGNTDSTGGLSGAGIIWGAPAAANLFAVLRRGANVTTYDIIPTVTNLAVGWHQVFLTVDSVIGAKLYYDGVLVGANALTTYITSSLPFRIGRQGNGADAFNGKIDSTMIYAAYVLSAAEIAYLNAFPYCMFDRQYPVYWGGAEYVPPPDIWVPRITMIL